MFVWASKYADSSNVGADRFNNFGNKITGTNKLKIITVDAINNKSFLSVKATS